MTGGMLGVLFMIPLRKPMIVEDQDLIYPEGVACAKVLQAGEAGGSGMTAVFGALGLGALIKAMESGIGLVGAGVNGAMSLGGSRVWFGMAASPALVAVGYIVGFNIAALVFVGGAISWFVGAPWLTATRDYLDTSGAVMALSDPGLNSLVKADVRFFGVGAMIVGGLWSIIQIRNGIVQGVRETFGGYKASMHGAAPPARTDRDMPRSWLLLLLSATTLVVLLLYRQVTGDIGIASLSTVMMVICSFFFVAVAAYIVGLVGSSNSPVSGMTICSVLLTSGVIALAGYDGHAAILATMGVAGVVCCATCTSGDVCQDLKTGNLIGATPYRQQWAEVIGVVTASFVMAPVLGLLHKGYGITTNAHIANPTSAPLEAPQASLFASLMQGFFGELTLPWDLIAVGAAVGLLIIAVDQLVLAPKKAKFRLFVMPVAVGMYLPLGLSTAILAGGLMAFFAARRDRKDPAVAMASHERGVLLASGLIAGEAIAGVLIAIPRAAEIKLPDASGAWTPWLGAAVVTLVLGLLYRARGETST
jgi:putative OPT family oligopeptide transporter